MVFSVKAVVVAPVLTTGQLVPFARQTLDPFTESAPKEPVPTVREVPEAVEKAKSVEVP